MEKLNSKKTSGKTYKERLSSPKWQKKRLEILNLKGFKCEECGDEENQIQVHHRFYIKGRDPWQYDNDVFQVLCEKCHQKEHQKTQIVEIVKEVIPPKYQKLITALENYSDGSNYAIGSLEFIIEQAIISCDYKLIDDLGWLFNTHKSEVFMRNIRDLIDQENTEIELWSAINELRRALKINTP